MRQAIAIVICSLILALLLDPARDAFASAPQKRVLVLYSEDKTHPAHELTDQGIRAGFRSNGRFDVRLYPEYLDLARFGGPGYTQATADFLRRKYAASKIDAIISVYPAALDFLMGEGSGVLPGVPIVASELPRVSAGNLDRSSWRPFTTGVILGDNIAGLLDSVFRMKPGTKRIALIAGTSVTDIHGEEIFLNGLKPYAEKIDLIDLRKLSMQETLARVGSLPPDTIVFYSTIFRDGAGQGFVPRQALSLISSAANAPVFGLYDSYMGYGIVGGRLVSLEKQGREAAALALRIMGGDPPASIPFGGKEAYVNLYDWRELKRWGISETVLPSGSIVKFKPPSIWEEHRGTVLGGLFFMTVETLLIIGLLVNYRRRKRAEWDAQQRRKELSHVSRVFTMGELTSSLAHELNQPLTAIRNYANAARRFLSQGEPDLSKAKEALEGIIRDDRRAVQVIQRVRGLLNKEESRYGPVPVNDVILETLTFLRNDSLLEGLSIETELAPELPAVLGDRIQLQQVLLNLILNAVDAINKAKSDLRKLVIKTEKQEDRGVKISVRDYGAGIDETHRDKLFEPFFSTKPGGMGMGLAISERIIHAHEGSIWAENNPDRGATFYFTLPIATER